MGIAKINPTPKETEKESVFMIVMNITDRDNPRRMVIPNKNSLFIQKTPCPDGKHEELVSHRRNSTLF